jgi:hypothetical protein
MKTLIWWAAECSGGLCDRLLGMVTTYCIARELRRKFLIKIDNFDMPTICPINRKYDYRYNSCSYVSYIPHNLEQQSFFSDKRCVEQWENIENVLMWSNQNLFYYFCKNRPEIDYRSRLLEGFSLLFTEILYLEPVCSKNTDDYIGIHIRTVDKQMTDCEEKVKQIPYIREVLTKCKKHLEGDSEYKVFITSDCDISYGIAKEMFREVLYNEGEIVHSGSVTEGEGLKKVFRDLLMLSKCKKVYMGWNTNFSKVSALLNGEREFYVYEYPGSTECVSCDILDIGNYFSQPYWR